MLGRRGEEEQHWGSGSGLRCLQQGAQCVKGPQRVIC